MLSKLPATFPYNPQTSTYRPILLIFGACSLFFSWMAVTYKGSLEFKSLVISADYTPLTFWILTGVSGVFVLLGLILLVQRWQRSVELVITDSSARIPSGFMKRRITEVLLTDVSELSETEVYKQHFFYLHTPSGRHSIVSGLLPSHEDYVTVKLLIEQAWKANAIKHT